MKSTPVWMSTLFKLSLMLSNPNKKKEEYTRKPNGPQAFNLVITPADDEQNITELITDETTGSRGRIFTDEFSEQFN